MFVILTDEAEVFQSRTVRAVQELEALNRAARAATDGNLLWRMGDEDNLTGRNAQSVGRLLVTARLNRKNMDTLSSSDVGALPDERAFKRLMVGQSLQALNDVNRVRLDADYDNQPYYFGVMVGIVMSLLPSMTTLMVEDAISRQINRCIEQNVTGFIFTFQWLNSL